MVSRTSVCESAANFVNASKISVKNGKMCCLATAAATAGTVGTGRMAIAALLGSGWMGWCTRSAYARYTVKHNHKTSPEARKSNITAGDWRSSRALSD